MGQGIWHRRGGSLGLYRLLLEHGEAIEADLARYYGIELGAVLRGTLTWRRLGVLVRQLPRDSALARALDPEEAAWSLGDHLLATVAELVSQGNWLLANQGVEKSKQSPQPKRIARPGVDPDAKETRRHGSTEGMDPKAVAEFLIRLAPQEAKEVEHVD